MAAVVTTAPAPARRQKARQPPEERFRAPERRPWLNAIGRHTILIICSVIFFGPFAWMILVGFKSATEASAYPPTILPTHWHFGNYVSVFQQAPFGRFYFNSIFTAGLSTIGQVVTSAFAGYAFARLRFPGRNVLFFVLMGALLVPFQVVFVPLVELLGKLHWLNSYPGLIVPNIPSIFGAFLFRQFFVNFPTELEDAAKVDGAGLVKRFLLVIAPLSRSVAAAFGILAFVYNFSNFFYQYVVVNTENYMTVSLGLTLFQAQTGTASEFNLLMAASAVSVVPTLIVFLIFQKQIVRGIALSGLK